MDKQKEKKRASRSRDNSPSKVLISVTDFMKGVAIPVDRRANSVLLNTNEWNKLLRFIFVVIKNAFRRLSFIVDVHSKCRWCCNPFSPTVKTASLLNDFPNVIPLHLSPAAMNISVARKCHNMLYCIFVFFFVPNLICVKSFPTISFLRSAEWKMSMHSLPRLRWRMSGYNRWIVAISYHCGQQASTLSRHHSGNERRHRVNIEQ